MERRLSNIFKTTNVTKLTKTILKSSYRVLQITSKWKKLKQPVHFLIPVEFLPTFEIQISMALAVIWKSCKTTLFKKPTEVSQNMPTLILEPAITK